MILQWGALAGGAFLVAATIASVVGTLIVPRDTQARVASFVSHVFVAMFRRSSHLFRSYGSKDAFLAFQGPLFLLVLLATWLSLLITGFALLLWAFSPVGLATAFREAGSSLLTLGFATTRSPGATVLDLIAAAAGLVVIALLIGYLPVIYGAYNRRETSVTMLESRAGAPAWGPEILWRHHRIGIVDSMPAFYEHWETWCADVAESHSTYPVLLYFRSPDPLRSWLTGLVAVLDSAALYNALCPAKAPSQTRLSLRMGFTTLRTLAEAIGVPFDPDPRPDGDIELSYEEYRRGVQRLVDIGFPVERTIEEAWPHFRGWRVNYEGVALALADRIVATPGPWLRLTSMPTLMIPTKRPVDRTPEEPEGTPFTKPGSYEES